MKAGNRLSRSMEDYLETIYLIIRDQGEARSKDIVKRIGVSAASVTEALRVLDAKGFIRYVPYSLITLTPVGAQRAREIFHRHETLRDFFVVVLGVDPETADSSACRVEHVISDEILESMITYTSSVLRNSRSDADMHDGLSDSEELPHTGRHTGDQPKQQPIAEEDETMLADPAMRKDDGILR